MIGLSEIAAVIGRPQLEAIRASGLPQRATMTLLSIWTYGSPKALKKLSKDGNLLPKLFSLKANLEDAADVMGSMGHVTEAEALQMCELPLTL